MNTTTIRQLLMAVACTITLSTQAMGDTSKNIDIPAGRLIPALKALGAQTGVEFVYSTDQLEGLSTKGVHGELTPENAVAKLLEGTKLTVTMHQSGAVLIAAPQAIPSAVKRDPVELRVAQSSSSDTQEGSATSEPASAASEDKSVKLEEIIVTAQRYEQKLADVPISISVFTGKELDMSSEASVNDALLAVPGLNLTTRLEGGASKISIRGVNSFLGSNTVGYYVDGVPFGFVVSDFAPDPGAFDLERVEVLRGPQGTLYGANALNGVIRVLSKDADLDNYELKGRALVSSIDGGGQNSGADAVVNAPIVPGKLAARLMLSYNHKGGYIDNFVADDINDGKFTNIRLKINAQPTEDLSVKLGYWRSRSDLGSLPISFPGSDFYPGDEACDAATVNFEGTPLCVPPTAGNKPEKIDRFDVYSAAVAYNFGSFTASNTASYMDYSNRFLIDWSGFRTTNHYFFQFGVDGPFYYSQSSKVFTNELNLNSQSDGPWVWSAGAIYRDAKDRTATRSAVFGPGVPSQNESSSYAVFGESTRSFADGALELTGGIRYFHDEVHQFEPGGIYDVTSTFNHVSPRVVLTWHPDKDMTVYASYAQGFRSGLNQPADTEAPRASIQ